MNCQHVLNGFKIGLYGLYVKHMSVLEVKYEPIQCRLFTLQLGVFYAYNYPIFLLFEIYI